MKINNINNNQHIAYKGRITEKYYNFLKMGMKDLGVENNETKRFLNKLEELYSVGSTDTIYDLTTIQQGGVTAAAYVTVDNETMKGSNSIQPKKLNFPEGKFSFKAFYNAFMNLTKEDFEENEKQVYQKTKENWLYGGCNPYYATNSLSQAEKAKADFLNQLKEIKQNLKGSTPDNTEMVRADFQTRVINEWLEKVKEWEKESRNKILERDQLNSFNEKIKNLLAKRK